MASSQERKPGMVSFRNHKSCSCWIQRPQALRKIMLLKRNTMATSQKKDHALVRIQRPQALNFKRSCSCWIQRPQAIKQDYQANVICIKLTKLTLYQCQIDTLASSFWKYIITATGKIKTNSRWWISPLKSVLHSSYSLPFIWTDHLHHHTKCQGNHASNESGWGQKTLKI
jgi:hypothetical protein